MLCVGGGGCCACLIFRALLAFPEQGEKTVAKRKKKKEKKQETHTQKKPTPRWPPRPSIPTQCHSSTPPQDPKPPNPTPRQQARHAVLFFLDRAKPLPSPAAHSARSLTLACPHSPSPPAFFLAPQRHPGSPHPGIRRSRGKVTFVLSFVGNRQTQAS